MSAKRILIVEDEPITAMLEQSVVQGLGHEVIGISMSGAAAIEAVEKEFPDLILMDIKLSGEMDGREAALIIQKQHDIPILFITAYDELSIPEGYAYIIKTFAKVELSNAIKELLDEGRE